MTLKKSHVQKFEGILFIKLAVYKFYIQLHKLLQKSLLNLFTLVNFLPVNVIEISHNKHQNSFSCCWLILELYRGRSSNLNFTLDDYVKHLASIAKGDSKIHTRMETLLNPFKKKTITLTWFKTVDKLPAGSAFGERALLKNEDRAATIVCSKDCTFATLHRKDYNSIIGAAVKRELKQKVDFLRGFRMFS